MQKTTTCLMFVGDQHGKAEEAMNFYVSLFENSSIASIDRYGPGEPEPEHTVKRAEFVLDGQHYFAMDSAAPHQFTFTPAVSLVVTCESEVEIDRLFLELSREGMVLMELAKYPFSEKFAWVNDRFGVSWQLNLPSKVTRPA